MGERREGLQEREYQARPGVLPICRGYLDGIQQVLHGREDMEGDWSHSREGTKQPCGHGGVSESRRLVRTHTDAYRFTQMQRENNAPTQRTHPAPLPLYLCPAPSYEADNNAASNANGMFIKVADLAAEVEDYKKAIQIYEKVSKSSVESSALRWSVKDHLFKALLCHFALAAPSHKLEPVSRKLEQYVDMCPNMDNTREKGLIEDLIADFDAASPDDYADHVFKFDEIMPLDRWKSKVLLQIKKCLEGGNPEDGVGV